MNPQIWVIWYVNTELLIRFSFTVKCWCQNQCEWLHRFCKFSTSTFFSHWDTLVRGSQNCSCSLDSLEIQNIVKKQNWDRLRNLQVVVQKGLLSYIPTAVYITDISLLTENKALHGRFNTWNCDDLQQSNPRRWIFRGLEHGRCQNHVRGSET